MGKFYGAIGFVETTESTPGVWTEGVTERNYYGDVTKISSRWQQAGDKVNDDLEINNQISIVADPYAYSNFHAIRYLTWMGVSWKIKKVEVARPRLILTLGGVYNG